MLGEIDSTSLSQIILVESDHSLGNVVHDAKCTF